MQVRYEFVTGEVVNVEVSREVWEASEEIRIAQARRERTETRRHELHSALDVEDEWFTDGRDTADLAMRNIDIRTVRQAVDHLTPRQRQVVQALYLRQKPMSRAECATWLGISEDGVKKLVGKARKNLVKILREGYP